MCANPYEKGRAFEDYIARRLRNFGYYVVRSAGSKGAFDLIAIKDGIPYGIQCKKRAYLSNDEKERIMDAYAKYKITPILATKKGGRIVFIDLRTGETINMFKR